MIICQCGCCCLCYVAMESEEKVAEMRRILTEELPDDNYFILKYVVHFLTEVFTTDDSRWIILYTFTWTACCFMPTIGLLGWFSNSLPWRNLKSLRVVGLGFLYRRLEMLGRRRLTGGYGKQTVRETKQNTGAFEAQWTQEHVAVIRYWYCSSMSLPGQTRTGRKRHNALRLSVDASVTTRANTMFWKWVSHCWCKLAELVHGARAWNVQLWGSGGQRSRSHEAEDRSGSLSEASFSTL